MRRLLKPLSFIPALFLMYMIFSFSAQTGEVSSQLSFKVSCKIVEAGDYIFDANLEQWQVEEWAGKIHFITRKLAHMTVYFALAVAVSFPLYVYGMHGFLLMLTAGIICVGFACGDEYHQAFVAGRGPSAKDVAIDSVGVFLGIIVVRIVGWTGRKTIFRPKAKKIKRPKNDFYRQAPPYRDDFKRQVPYNDDPFVNPPYGKNRGKYQEDPYYPERPPYQEPYPGGQPYYEDPPYDDPYQNPDFQVHPPQESDWDSIPYDNPALKQKKKKKKKEKDWFFDL